MFQYFERVRYDAFETIKIYLLKVFTYADVQTIISTFKKDDFYFLSLNLPGEVHPRPDR